MSRITVTKSLIDDIADTIREKLSSEDKYKIEEMPSAIDSIGGGASNVIFSVDLVNKKFQPTTAYDDYNRQFDPSYTVNNWNGKGMYCQSTYASSSDWAYFIDGADSNYKYTITYNLGIMWDSDLESGVPRYSKQCYYLQHWGVNKVAGFGYHNTESDGGNWRIVGTTTVDLPLTDIHDLDNETLVIEYIPSTSVATYTVKGASYSVTVDKNNRVACLGIGGYDNTALTSSYIKNITITRDILE